MPAKRRHAIVGKDTKRSRLLKRALAIRGLTLREYADMLDVHPDYVRHLAAGRMTSPRTLAKIDAFIRSQLPNEVIA